MKKFIEWIKINYPNFLIEQDNSIKPWITSPIYNPINSFPINNSFPKTLDKWHPENSYKANEIIIKKQIIPKDFIRSAQPNPEKWDKDFQNLQKPGMAPSQYHLGPQWMDIGFATHKDYFDKPIIMYVVTDEALERVYPDAGAYADCKDGWIVIPKKCFTVLPTASSDGKLTQWGGETLAHELRHTTQKGNVPKERWLNSALPGNINDRTSPRGKRYYQHPMEMGVRLAAIKNSLDENLRQQIKKEFSNNFIANILENSKEVLKRIPLDDFLDEGITNDESIILNPEKWVNIAYSEIKRKLNDGNYYNNRDIKFIKNNIFNENPEMAEQQKRNMLHRARERKNQYLYKQELLKLGQIEPKNEKEMLVFILDPKRYANIKLKNLITSQTSGKEIFKIYKEFERIANLAKKQIYGEDDPVFKHSFKNSDAASLINFFNTLNDQQKENYLDELLRFYDQVVKTGRINNQIQNS